MADNDIKREENGYENGVHSGDRDDALRKIRSAASVSISPDLFEKLYLSPPNKVKGDLRKTFGNPTPISLAGFILSLTPLTCDLMGWRGAGGNGAASIPVYFFQGGILMTIGGILEWILGNSFPAIVFMVFGTFWMSFGGTLNPQFAAYSSYAPPTGQPTDGLQTTGFNASFGFWLLCMGLICFLFMIASVRTNVVFFFIFVSLVFAFSFLTGAFWALAKDATANAAFAKKLTIGGGACAFVTTCLGWYIFTAILLAIVDFPFTLPVGDLSTIVKGKSDKAARRG